MVPGGFALVEVLVATSVVLILAGGILMVALPTGAGFTREPAANDVQERLRAAVEALRLPLLEAGSGPGVALGGLTLGLVVPSIMPYRVGLRRPDPPGTFRRDLVTIVSSLPGAAAPTIQADFQGSVGSVTVGLPPGCPLGHPSCGIEPGMTVMLLDASGQADLYGVSSVTENLVWLEARGLVTARRYAAGARLIPVELVTFYLRAASGPDGPQLARYDGVDSDLPVVDHIVELTLEYFGDPQPPRPRAHQGLLGDTMTYGPAPPPPGEDDERDNWGAGENCVVAIAAAVRVPRLAELGDARSPLRLLPAESLADGPWCPDEAAGARFDADLLRVRKVRVTLRAEAWSDAMRGRDERLFLRPGTSTAASRWVPDERVTLDVVPRAPGGTR
jgi:hypothetical protein